MMFSIALKNGIIMIFMILCTHVLIIKYILIHKDEYFTESFVTIPSQPEIDNKQVNEILKEPFQDPIKEPLNEKPIEPEDDELLTYIKSLEKDSYSVQKIGNTNDTLESNITNLFFINNMDDNIKDSNDKDFSKNINGYDNKALSYSEFEKVNL